MQHQRLAIATGFATPERMYRKLSYREIRRLELFDAIEPVGDRRRDLQAAAVVRACSMSKKPPAIHQIFEWWNEPEGTPRQSPEDMERQWAKARRLMNRNHDPKET